MFQGGEIALQANWEGSIPSASTLNEMNMGTASSKKKAEQLGMSFGKASYNWREC